MLLLRYKNKNVIFYFNAPTRLIRGLWNDIPSLVWEFGWLLNQCQILFFFWMVPVDMKNKDMVVAAIIQTSEMSPVTWSCNAQHNIYYLSQWAQIILKELCLFSKLLTVAQLSTQSGSSSLISRFSRFKRWRHLLHWYGILFNTTATLYISSPGEWSVNES